MPSAGGAGPRRPRHQRSEHKALGGVGGDERDLVNPFDLSEPVDAAGALLETGWTPGQLVVKTIRQW